MPNYGMHWSNDGKTWKPLVNPDAEGNEVIARESDEDALDQFKTAVLAGDVHEGQQFRFMRIPEASEWNQREGTCAIVPGSHPSSGCPARAGIDPIPNPERQATESAAPRVRG